MQKSTKVSFVLPCRNEIEQIEKTVDSLINQTVKCEIIVIDDNSHDGTYKLLLEKYYGKIIILRNERHMGSAHSRNKGNMLARTPYVSVCDCDTYYPKRAEILHKYMVEYPDFDVYYTGHDCWKEGRDITHFPTVEPVDNFFDGQHVNKKMPIRHPTVCYKASVALKHPYPEVSLETDCFEKFFMTLMKKGYTFKNINEITMCILRGTTKRDKHSCMDLRKKQYAEFGIRFSK